MKYFMVLLSVLSLGAFDKLSAIGITTIGGNSSLTSFVSRSGAGFEEDTEAVAAGLSSFNRSTSADVGSAFTPLTDPLVVASGFWALTNSATVATFGGADLFNRNDALTGDSLSRNTGFLDISLTQSVIYDFSGFFVGDLNSGATASLTAAIIDLGLNAYHYLEVFGASSDFNYALDSAGVIGSKTGLLTSGNYRLFWNSEIVNDDGGEAGAGFTVSLTAQGGPVQSVPDAGSTVMLLGMALTALGGIRHKLKI